MSEQLFTATTDLCVTQQQAFAYHERTGALERLLPPWEQAKVLQTDNSLAPGSQVVLQVKQFGIPLRWVAEHTAFEPPHRFIDVQRSGPFKSWHHEHLFSADVNDPTRSQLTDRVTYTLPAGFLGQAFGGSMVARQLQAMFDYRHRITRHDLQLQQRYPTQSSLRVAISGARGLVGKPLSGLLSVLGHEPYRLVRGASKEVAGDQHLRELPIWEAPPEAELLSGFDAVIHLAGESVAEGRWTAEKKREIRDSRVKLTKELVEKTLRSSVLPKVLICASAVGIYGDRGDEILTEEASTSDSFLGRVAEEWEAACEPAKAAGIRVVNLRFGIILSPRGGALKAMMLPAKMFGGRTGNGKQWCSWIAMEDCLGAIYHSLMNESVAGPVNVVAPNPVMNQDFAATLAKVLGRRALFPAPAAALRLVFGEMADDVLLASTRVAPKKLLETGFQFQFPELEPALRHLLGR